MIAVSFPSHFSGMAGADLISVQDGNPISVAGPDKFLLQFRLRHGLTRARMARLVGMSPRRLADLEHGETEKVGSVRSKVLEISHRLPGDLLSALSKAVVNCRLPRALCRSNRLELRAVSGPAIRKRPSVVNWIGKDLAPIACGVLQEMRDDLELQRAILRREVVSVVTTTQSVLRTADDEAVGALRTTISYFFHDGVLFSDAIGLPVSAEERMGYTPLYGDEIGTDLFGDCDALAAMLAGNDTSVSSVSGRG